MFQRYQNSKVLLNSEKKKRYLETIIYPTIEKHPEDTYIITTIGDRLDMLAFEYYKDVSLWYLIASANPDITFDSLYLEPGIQIRIPYIVSSNNITDLLAGTNLTR